MMYGFPCGGVAGGFGGFFMLLWWVVIIAAIVLLAKWLLAQSQKKNSGSGALEVLKERYARGEISKEEFEKKKQDIA